MSLESPPQPDTNEETTESQEYVSSAFGPATEDELESMAIADERRAREFDDLTFTRDPSDKVDVNMEKDRVATRLEAVRELKKEKQKHAVKGDAISGVEVKNLERAEQELEQDLEQIRLADESNDALGELRRMKESDTANFESLMETGKDTNGHEMRLKGSGGRELRLDSHQMKHLAGLANRGISHVTWEDMTTLYQVVDKIIEDIKSVVKGVVGMG